MENPSRVLDKAVRIIKEQTAGLKTVLSVEPLGRDRVLLTTVHGPLIFLVGRLPDGRIELAEEPAADTVN